MQAKGRAFKYGDNVDTDVIIPARYLNSSDPAELATHCMEDIDNTFVKRVQKGDIIVATKNFGCGSSREHAPIAIKAAGVSCVIAETFARIFYRNAINIGLPIIECPEAAKDIQAGDEVEAGTVVVSGMIPIQDDSGETVSYDLCAADADVTIHTILPYEDHFSAKKQVREQIGKAKYGIGVLTGDGQLNLFWQQKAQTGCIRIYRQICLGRDFYLPFTLVTERLWQYENNETDRTEAEIKRIAQEKLDNYIQKLEKNAIQILSNSVIIEKNATEVSVHGTLDAMVTVSRRTEIENTKTQEGTDKYGIDTTVVGHSD